MLRSPLTPNATTQPERCVLSKAQSDAPELFPVEQKGHCALRSSRSHPLETAMPSLI
jgi:hypothetical protein